MSKKVLKNFSQFFESNRQKRISVEFISLNKHTAKNRVTLSLESYVIDV